MTIDYLKEHNLIILECISGSKAYGLDTASSDTDIKGVFLLPKKDFYGLQYTAQVSNPSNDIVYYEFNRYMELLSRNNPNILELLHTPKSSIIYKHPYLEALDPQMILSKLCKNTFGKFALSQMKKAKGLNKKIVNPLSKVKKNILAFCYVSCGQGSLPLLQYLKRNNWKQEHCGLVKVAHMKDVFALFYNENLHYNGILKHELSNGVCLSSVPKNEKPKTLLYFNKDGYSKYCKEYKEYWSWVKHRNEERYQNTQSHGKNYDAKNMMHVFRLLEMAIEIAKEKVVNVERPNRKFLLEIKNGKYEYEELLSMAQELQKEMELVFASSTLPEKPDMEFINRLTFQIRNKFYQENGSLEDSNKK